VQADATALPLADGSIDLVFANLVLPWIVDLPTCFAEVNRVLGDGGAFVFSTLGTGSLATLRDAWAAVDEQAHVAEFTDMHDVGDALVHAGLAEPVLDADTLTVTFSSAAKLYADLSACGARNSLAGRRGSLTGRQRFRRAESLVGKSGSNGGLAVGLELVFGHAWSTGPRLADGEYHVQPSQIGRRRNR
jgi:malonyl-CoA O-methyltransferase